MKFKKIILKKGKNNFSLVVGECSYLEKFLGLMVFRKKALLLFNLKKPHKLKIHSILCKPFLAVYTDGKNRILEIIEVKKWKLSILPKEKYNRLIEIPLVEKYKTISKNLLEIPLNSRL